MLDPEAVDLETLADALSDQGTYGAWWFDPNTGEPGFWPYDADDEEDAEQAKETMVRVDPLPSRVWYQDMVDFADQLDDEQARRRLARALRGRGAFRHFRDELYEEYPELVTPWNVMRRNRGLVRAMDWLLDNDFVSQETRDRFADEHPDPPIP